MPATKSTAAAAKSIGSMSVIGLATGAVQPSGVVHLVDDAWRPVCGDKQVSYLFPGRSIDGTDACPRCTAAPRARTRRN